ncbi:MAG: hypothetical protein WKF57_04890 [Nakamurella sp.]
MTVTQPLAPPVPFTLADGPLRLAVIGGTTAFLCEFVRDLGSTNPDEVTWDLRLLGRNPGGITRMTEFAGAVVPPPHHVLVTADSGRALEGADVILVQPRVGGLSARAADEDLAAEVGAPADEGLGPGGLRAALRLTPVLRGLAEEIHRRAPDALSIGFSNPLSTTVAALSEAGLSVVGTCELPGVTADEIANRLQVDTERLTWGFVGLNHRGFLHNLRVDGEPALQQLLAKLTGPDDVGVGGIDREVIEQLGAVPLKYHAMLSGASVPPSGRARQLSAIRDRADRELDRQPREVPTALAGRSMPWYRQAVFPLLTALAGCGEQRMILDVRCHDGLVREIPCQVDQFGVQPHGIAAAPPNRVQHWVSRFEAHERAVSELLARPDGETLNAALRLDSATPSTAVGPLMDRLAAPLSALREEPTNTLWLAS